MPPDIDLRWRTLAAIALNALLIGVLVGLMVFPPARQAVIEAIVSPRPADSGVALVGGPFSLSASTGGAMSDRDLAGRVMIVTFGFSRDPDFTPALLQVIGAALTKLGQQNAQVAAVLITLDPVHDTTARLADYVVQFHPRLVGLTGSPEAIAAVAKAYRLPLASTVDPASPSPVPISFEPLIYLINRKGEYVTHLSHNSSPEALLAAIRAVL